MAFTVFSNSTTAYADQVHANMIHCGQSDLLPLANSATMGATSGVYNIGSTSYKWNNIFVNNVDSFSTVVDSSWRIIAEGGMTGASSVDVNATFSNYNDILVICSNNSNICFNHDTALAHYITIKAYAQSNTVNYDVATAGSMLYGTSFISTKTGNVKYFSILLSQYVTASSENLMQLRFGRYTETGTITSITIYNVTAFPYYAVYGR